MDQVLRRFGRIVFSTFSKVSSKPIPLSGRKPSSFILSLNTYGLMPEKALSWSIVRKKEAMVALIMASNSFLSSFLFDRIKGLFDIFFVNVPDDFLKNPDSCLQVFVAYIKGCETSHGRSVSSTLLHYQMVLEALFLDTGAYGSALHRVPHNIYRTIWIDELYTQHQAFASYVPDDRTLSLQG